MKTLIELTKRQKLAMRLLARGGARYGTMHSEMTELKAMGLCYAHDKGTRGKGRWTWRPTPAGLDFIAANTPKKGPDET